MRNLFKKITFEYIVFPQLLLVKTLKTPQKGLFFIAMIIFLPYNILLLSAILGCFFLVFVWIIFIEILKKIFIKRSQHFSDF